MGHLIAVGDARRLPIASESVHCVVCSPPYFSLRDYGIAGQVGLEASPEAYVATMVGVCREIRRVMRPDATFWLNLGDSFAGGGGGNYGQGKSVKSQGGQQVTNVKNRDGWLRDARLKPKDLIGIPWRVALALQADGWYLRSEIIWEKPNAMPESVGDRPSRTHEQVFLFSKRSRYYYDPLAIREKAVQPKGVAKRYGQIKSEILGQCDSTGALGSNQGSEFRTCRSVWRLNTQPFKGSHFATFPVTLAARCIKAGTSSHGVCPNCGSPWRRVTEKKRTATRHGRGSKVVDLESSVIGNRDPLRHVTTTKTLGWEPTCKCGADLTPVPAVVLDPFNGAGTTGVAALGLGRSYVGVELNPAYAAMAGVRISRPHAPVVKSRKAAPMPLFGEE